MDLTENTATALLAQNGLEVRPNSAVSVEDMEAGPAEEDQKVAVLTGIVDEEEATDMDRGLAKKAFGFRREPVGRA